MLGYEDFERACLEKHAPLLQQIERTLEAIAADNDEATMNLLVNSIALLVEVATSGMVEARIDQDGGSPTPH